jgi:hypothetical protein
MVVTHLLRILRSFAEASQGAEIWLLAGATRYCSVDLDHLVGEQFSKGLVSRFPTRSFPTCIMYPWVRQAGFQGAFVHSVDSGPNHWQAQGLQEGATDVPDAYLQFVVFITHPKSVEN